MVMKQIRSSGLYELSVNGHIGERKSRRELRSHKGESFLGMPLPQKNLRLQNTEPPIPIRFSYFRATPAFLCPSQSGSQISRIQFGICLLVKRAQRNSGLLSATRQTGYENG